MFQPTGHHRGYKIQRFNIVKVIKRNCKNINVKYIRTNAKVWYSYMSQRFKIYTNMNYCGKNVLLPVGWCNVHRGFSWQITIRENLLCYGLYGQLFLSLFLCSWLEKIFFVLVSSSPNLSSDLDLGLFSSSCSFAYILILSYLLLVLSFDGVSSSRGTRCATIFTANSV